jgi:hypothetical protein
MLQNTLAGFNETFLLPQQFRPLASGWTGFFKSPVQHGQTWLIKD